MAFWVMPTAILAAVLSIVGQGDIAFQAMGYGVEGVLAAAYIVQASDGGVIHAAVSPGWVVGAFMTGGGVICALREWPRWLGHDAVGTAILGVALASTPDMLVDEKGRIAAVHDGDRLYCTSTRRGAFE